MIYRREVNNQGNDEVNNAKQSRKIDNDLFD